MCIFIYTCSIKVERQMWKNKLEQVFFFVSKDFKLFLLSMFLDQSVYCLLVEFQLWMWCLPELYNSYYPYLFLVVLAFCYANCNIFKLVFQFNKLIFHLFGLYTLHCFVLKISLCVFTSKHSHIFSVHKSRVPSGLLE